MKQRSVFALGVLVAVGLLVYGIPAQAASRGHATPKSPKVGVTWVNGASFPGPDSPYRWDGALYLANKRVYFLGYRDLITNNTVGTVWYYDVVTKTFHSTTVTMPVPVSNYQIATLTDSNGALGFYIFGGRDNAGNIVTTVQAFYPATNTTADYTANDPWPGTTPSACVSLPAMGVATLGDNAYVMGGASFSVNGCVDDQSAQVWRFNPKGTLGHKWKAMPSLKVALGYITPGVLGHTIYAIGGDTNVGGTLFASDTVESWTPGNASWNDTGVADLPQSGGCDEAQASGFLSGPLANDVVLEGCGQWPADLPDTWLYNSVSNSWSDVGAFNNSRRNHAGALIGSKMYVFGGVTGSGLTGVLINEIGSGHTAINRPGYMGPDRIGGGARPPTS